MCRRITWLFKIQHEPEYIHFNDLNCTSIHSWLSFRAVYLRALARSTQPAHTILCTHQVRELKCAGERQ
jgi:hypothetical protein